MASKRCAQTEIELTQETAEKLKRIKISSNNLFDENLSVGKVLSILLNILEGEKEVYITTHNLYERFNNETESIIRVKLLSALNNLCEATKHSASNIIDDIVVLVREESNKKVICQALKSLYELGHYKALPKFYINKILNFAQEKVFSESHNVQRYALLILGAFTGGENSFCDGNIISLISKYTDSQDSRVRVQAFNSMLKLGQKGVQLSPFFFNRCLVGLTDDDDYVRKEALHLMFEIAVTQPDELINVPNYDGVLRLIDIAFEKVCSSLCDFSLSVRILAAKLLGSMNQVGQVYLHQTLDKKLMTNLKRKKSLHTISSESLASGEWSCGKKWLDDAPRELVKPNSISLIASGSCGAFVHGLEDEFMEVRSASVDSLCKLATIHPEFASQSLDFLVDMFNDEIEDVRLKAIHSLNIISSHIILREDQLEIMLSSLEDHSTDIREGLHLMLGSCKVSTPVCLLMVIHKVLNVLTQYPQDILSAYGCMQKLGEKHSDICMTLTTQLIQDHPCFDCPERDVEDPSYICILIMLFNAAVHQNAMVNLFPDVTIKHYYYLRDTMPIFVPHLQLQGVKSSLVSTLTGSFHFLTTISKNVNEFCKASRERSTLLKSMIEKLKRLAEIDQTMSGTAQFTAISLESQMLIEQLRIGTINQQSGSPSKIFLCQLMNNCLKLQNRFSGLSIEDFLLVKEISLQASAIHLILVVKDKSQSALGSCKLLFQIAADIKQFLQMHKDKIADILTTNILDKLSKILDPKPGRVFREICPIFRNGSRIITPLINTNIKMCEARIIEPSKTASLENILKVTSGLIASLNVVAEIENLEENKKKDLRLKLKYPDQNIHIVSPRITDLKHISNDSAQIKQNFWRLRTNVLLSHGVWTESSFVEITLCLFVRPVELELSNTIKILFSPKPIRRGF